MARYVVYAMEGRYQGLHGISAFAVVDADNEKEVHEIAREMSLDVMESYRTIDEELEEDEEYDEDYVEELRNENIEYDFHRVKDDCPFTDEEIDFKIYNDYRGFVDKWGSD